MTNLKISKGTVNWAGNVLRTEPQNEEAFEVLDAWRTRHAEPLEKTAAAMYAAKEQTPTCLRGDVQVVLVSTQRFKDLRQAYPSYFLDVAEFIQILKDFCYLS